MKNLILLTSSLVMLSACGSSNKAENLSGTERNQAAPTGELFKNVSEVLTSEYSEACDRSSEAQVREMAQALDNRVSEINQFITTLPPSTTTRLVPFGSSFLKEYVKLPAATDEWTSDSESWGDMYTLYLEIKDQPMSRKWMNLNSGVRSLVLNDQMRVLDGMNMDLRHDSGPKIDALKVTVDACIQDSNCIIPKYTPEDQSFIASVDFYRYYRKKNESTQDRAVLARFQKRLGHDQSRYAFRINPSIQLSEQNGKTILHLPVDGSIFSPGQQQQLQGYIESVWTSNDLDLKINWVESMANVFKMFFEIDRPGERAYVNWSEREVHLFPLTRTRSVAHELGHVIGFKDHYYTTWNPEKCEYLTEGNYADLMSDVTGNVTSAEWAQLKLGYHL